MKFILEYKSYNRSSYNPGDIVLAEYWYLDEPGCDERLHKVMPYTPVKILEKRGRSFLVSHDVEGSGIRNAPEELVKAVDIIDFAR
jgi:hypothetical protein